MAIKNIYFNTIKYIITYIYNILSIFILKNVNLKDSCKEKSLSLKVNLSKIRALRLEYLLDSIMESKKLESKALGFIAFVLRLESKNLGLITKLRLESKELESKVESFVWDCKVIVFAVLALTLEFVLECKTWLLRGVLLPPPPQGIMLVI